MSATARLPIRPGTLSPRRKVPREIPRPDYALLGEPENEDQPPRPRTPDEVAAMRRACDAASDALEAVAAEIAPGVSTDELDRVGHEAMVAAGGYPSTLNYKGYRKSICTSVNEVVCHGIPAIDTVLADGDLVTVDVTIYLDGMHGDLNQTFGVGEITQQDADLMEATRRAQRAGIDAVRPGGRVRDVGKAIEREVRGRYGIVHQFGGHGLGPAFHDGLHVPHHYEKQATERFFPGQTLTVEPMLTVGRSGDLEIWAADGWTAATVDGTRSAQEEHTLLVTETGVEVLTRHVPH